MAITNDKLDTGKRTITKVKYLKAIPYTDENGETLGTESFEFDTLLGDSVSIQPDDNTVNSRESETKDEPAIENIILGSYQFSATTLDLQDKILKNLMGWTLDDTDSISYAPTSYSNKWAMIIVAFQSTDSVLVLPRVKLNSKTILASLKTSSGEGEIAGTAYAGKITVNSLPVSTPMAFIPSAKLETAIPELAGE